MDLLIKAKLRPVAELVRNREDFNCGIEMDMLEHAGEEVTVTSFDQEDECVYIKEDGGYNTWSPEMFVGGLKELPKAKAVRLGQEIQDNSHVDVQFNGDVSVGCQNVAFNDLEKIYNASLAQRAEYADLLPKPKKKRKKKKKASKK